MELAHHLRFALLHDSPRAPEGKAVDGVTKGIARFERIAFSLPMQGGAADTTRKRRQQGNATARGPLLARGKLGRRIENFRWPPIGLGQKSEAVKPLAHEDAGSGAGGGVADRRNFRFHGMKTLQGPLRGKSWIAASRAAVDSVCRARVCISVINVTVTSNAPMAR